MRLGSFRGFPISSSMSEMSNSVEFPSRTTRARRNGERDADAFCPVARSTVFGPLGWVDSDGRTSVIGSDWPGRRRPFVQIADLGAHAPVWDCGGQASGRILENNFAGVIIPPQGPAVTPPMPESSLDHAPTKVESPDIKVGRSQRTGSTCAVSPAHLSSSNNHRLNTLRRLLAAAEQAPQPERGLRRRPSTEARKYCSGRSQKNP